MLDVLCSDFGFCSSSFCPSLIPSLGNMLLIPVQLHQGPRGKEALLVFWEQRDRLSSSSGQGATILRNKC